MAGPLWVVHTVSSWVARRRATREARAAEARAATLRAEREEQAYKALVGTLTDGAAPEALPGPYRAELQERIERTARDMARRAPTSLATPPSLLQDESGESVQHITPFTPVNDEKSNGSVSLEELYADELPIEFDDGDGYVVLANQSERQVTDRQPRADKLLRDVVIPERAGMRRRTGAPAKTTIVASDAQFQANMFDATADDNGVVPTPQKADIRTIDLTARGYWESNPNASEEIQLAARVPIVNNQIRTIIEHLITSRPSIQGPPELVEPIRRWFEVEMELQTDHERGLDRFVTDVTKQLLYYGSCALVKQRTMSGVVDPFTDPARNTTVSPVWGYAVPDMSTMEVFVDTKGRARKWRQKSHLYDDGTPKEYRDRDVFLARLPTQNSSLYFWTPSYVMPALYAVQVLKDLHRLIESHTQSIIDYRYYCQVGSKDYMDGKVVRRQLDKVAHTINTTSRGGTPIVPWFVNLEKLDLDEYVEQLQRAASFWEQEVRRGVGGSMLQDGVGDSATRNTSDALTEKEMRAAQALVPEIQRAFRWLVADKMWEAGIKPDQIRRKEDWPSLEFEEIDMSQQIRRETHYNALWQNDGLTHDEYRKSIGRDEDTKRKGKYFTDIQVEISEAEAKVQTTEQLKLDRENNKAAEKMAEKQAQLAEKQAQTQLKAAEAGVSVEEKKVGLEERRASTQIKLEREKRETLKVKQKQTANKKATESQTRPGGSPRPKRKNQ